MSDGNLELLKNAKSVWPSDRASVGLDVACEWAVKEIERLQDIVAKLPMCWQLDVDGDDRELRQTCPVVPNMRLWIVTDSEIGNGRVVSLNKELISLTNGWVQHPDAYYNSLAAAEFAQQEAAANQQEKP